MVAALEKALAVILATPEVAALGDDTVWPLYADEGVEGLYITYRVDELATITKNAIAQDRLTVGVFDDDYLKIAEMADAIKAQVLKNDAGTNFFFEGSTSDFSNDLQTAFVSMSFTFKHK